MAELFNTYSVGEIISFVVTFALATKGLVTFWDWSVDRIKRAFNKQTQKEKERQILEEKIEHNEQKIMEVSEKQQENKEALDKITKSVDMLIQSDKDAIKSYITKEHHYYCYKQKWIDDYTLDCIEKRYVHYKDEGGNSFIGDLMEELRDLPKQPPQQQNK